MNLLLAQRFAQLRKEAGFSQEELAAKLGISRQAVSKWERGESSPDTDNLIALAKLYGVSLDALLLSENAPEVQKTAQKENGPDEKIPFDSKPDAPAAQEETVEKIKPNLRQRIYQFLYPVYVPLMVLLYLLLGVFGHWWHPAWILFLTIPVFYMGIYRGYPILAACLYLVTGSCFSWWAWAWVVFLTIPIFYGLYHPRKNRQ